MVSVSAESLYCTDTKLSERERSISVSQAQVDPSEVQIHLSEPEKRRKVRFFFSFF